MTSVLKTGKLNEDNHNPSHDVIEDVTEDMKFTNLAVKTLNTFLGWVSAIFLKLISEFQKLGKWVWGVLVYVITKSKIMCTWVRGLLKDIPLCWQQCLRV